MFDEGLNTIFLAGKGDTIFRSYEFSPSGLEKSSEFLSSPSAPITGVCMLPKRVCDIRNIEVCRLLKLTTEAVIPISFKVPRADHLKVYFHDDIYPPVRSKTAKVSILDWQDKNVSKSIFQPDLESLKPPDMTCVSERPMEELIPSASNVS